MTRRRNEHLPATQFDDFPHTSSLHSQVPIATIRRRRRRVFHLTRKNNLFRDRSPLRKRRERDSALTSTTASARMTGNGHGWLPATTTTKYTRIKPIEEGGFDRDVDVELSCRRSEGGGATLWIGHPGRHMIHWGRNKGGNIASLRNEVDREAFPFSVLFGIHEIICLILERNCQPLP